MLLYHRLIDNCVCTLRYQHGFVLCLKVIIYKCGLLDNMEIRTNFVIPMDFEDLTALNLQCLCGKI